VTDTSEDIGRRGLPHGGAAMESDDELLRAIVQSSVNPYVVLAPDGHIRWASERVQVLLGAPAASFIGRHFLEMVAPSSHAAAIAEYSEFTRRDAATVPWVGPPVQLDLIHADGSTIACEVSAATGDPHGIDGIVVQVRRWRGTVLLYAAVDSMAAGAPLVRVLHDILSIAEHDMPTSATFIATGWDGENFELIEAAPATAQAHADVRSQLVDLLSSPSAIDQVGLDELAVAAGYVTAWAEPITVRGDDAASALLVVLRAEPGRPAANHSTLHRVCRLAALAIESDRNRRAWRRSAVTDHLTDLANRAGLQDWLDDHAAVRPDSSMAVLFCDVDEFKQVNDDLGHHAGDRVLKVVAERLRRAVRDDDLVCRWGGDEFLIACADPAGAVALAERLIARVEEPITIDGATARVGLSVGVAFGTYATELDELLRASDRALLEAKAGGRNRFVVEP
jgi:diguanylate cyclase (GGDEF)-like protein/PAS domain S-box-containing protein